MLANVNRGFVDAGLIRFRSEDEIMAGIEIAITAAAAKKDLVALSRVGTLKYRTHERLEYTFNWSALADILLYTGRVDQVVNSIYSEDTDRVTAGDGYSLRIMSMLFELDMKTLGEKLFDAFRKDFHGSNELGKQGIVRLFKCAGLFKTNPAKVMRAIAGSRINREILERDELSVEYAPHLAAYLDGLVRSGRDTVWRRLKKNDSPFSNRLMRQLTIRAVASWRSVDELRSEIEEYIVSHPGDTNLELAYHAAMAGMKPETVNLLAGRFDFPREHASESSLQNDLQDEIQRFAYWAVVLGYDHNVDIVRQVKGRTRGSEAVWACIQSHLLIVGEVMGGYYGNREVNWFDLTAQAIEALEAAGDEPGERTPDALSAARSILDTSLGWLGRVIVEKCPEKIDDWFSLLKQLRRSFLWTTHYGIGELMADYSFEFPIWKQQAEIPDLRARIRPILLDCAETYRGALSLKGGARGDHFLTLASLAARCGFRNDAMDWLKSGIETSLAYGYRKDVTLEKLTDVLSILSNFFPEKVLPGAAAILEMNRWIPHATDGRSTKHFAQYVFPVIADHNRAAALGVLRLYYNEFARWQADESVAKYILAQASGDPEFLWALCGLLDSNESLVPRQHVLGLANLNSLESSDAWQARFTRFVETMINPRYWPNDIWDDATRTHPRPAREQRHQDSSPGNLHDRGYLLDGNEVTESEAIDRCRASFNEMVETFDKLKTENDYIPDYKLLEVLPEHIDNASNSGDLNKISEFIELNTSFGNSMYWEKVGRKYLNLGDTSGGLDCLERAIHESPTSEAFATLVEYDNNRAESFMVHDFAERLHGPEYYGFDAAYVIANACHALGNKEAVKRIYDDYLQHCLELFSQWPADRCFDELRDWGDAELDENEQIVNLLLDRLSAPAAAFGDRLVNCICCLAERRGETVIPFLAERLANASGLELNRLIQVFTRLSHSMPELCGTTTKQLAELLDRKDVFQSLAASRVINRIIANNGSVDADVQRATNEVTRRYSSTFAYRGFRILQTSPSGLFIDLIRNAAQVTLQREIQATSEILDIDSDSLLAQIERRFLESGTTLEEEKEAARSMLRAFTHPQGWPILWFVSDFHVEIGSLLYQAIDEVLQKQRSQSEHLEAIWRVIQPNDPEFSEGELQSKPNELAPLIVKNKDTWIRGGGAEAAVVVEGELPDGWITAYEFRQLQQDNPYHREFLTQTNVCSALVAPEHIDDIASFDPRSWVEQILTHHPAENLTWQQCREALIDGHLLQPDEDAPCIPFVAQKRRHLGFLGFHTIASLASKLVREHSLHLEGFSVFLDDEKVAYFEAWQEGYSDEDYNDEPLSFGVRLLANTDFITGACQSLGRAFALRTVENRFILKEYQQDPEESNSTTSICVWPIDAD